ncbi:MULTISPECIES: hypothetical protein [unclassified Streptomyces]
MGNETETVCRVCGHDGYEVFWEDGWPTDLLRQLANIPPQWR